MLPSGIYPFPSSTSNKRVPRGVFLVAKISKTSGEYIETYYITEDLYVFRCGDWYDSLPIRTSLKTAARIVEMPPGELSLKAQQWFNRGAEGKS